MKKRIFKLGETLIRKGDIPDSMFLMFRGTCKVVHISEAVRHVNPNIDKTTLRKPLKAFNFKQVGEIPKKKEAANIPIIDQYFPDEKVFKYSKRCFQYEPIDSKSSSEIRYWEHHELEDLNPGEMICTRALLAENIGLDGSELVNIPPNIKRAKFTIIARSSEVEVFEFQKQNIVFVPQPLKTIFLSGLRHIEDHDIKMNDKLEAQLLIWDKVKEKIYIKEMLNNRTADLSKVYKKY